MPFRSPFSCSYLAARSCVVGLVDHGSPLVWLVVCASTRATPVVERALDCRRGFRVPALSTGTALRCPHHHVVDKGAGRREVMVQDPAPVRARMGRRTPRGTQGRAERTEEEDVPGAKDNSV